MILIFAYTERFGDGDASQISLDLDEVQNFSLFFSLPLGLVPPFAVC